MARKQVIVQLDDQLVASLDTLAAEEGVSRSALIRRMALRFIEAARDHRADLKAIESYRRMPEDPVESEAFRRLAAEAALPYPYEEG